jgi:hypothetical protein
VGGLVGNVNDGIVTDSYGSGAVAGHGQSLVGGFVGYDSGGTYTDGYWDITTSGTKKGVGNLGHASGIVGLTTRKFRSGLPGGFDPTTWAESPHINNGLPYLINNPPPK